jgi:membrane protein required for colicin V production
MTALDIIVLLLVGGAGVLGMSRGFITETLSLGAWVLAIAAVKVLHSPVSAALAEPVGTDAGAAVLAFALIFGLTMLAGRMIARRIGEQSKKSVMGPFDRVLGLGFGAIKGLIGASLIFLFVSLIYDTIYGSKAKRPAWMEESSSYPLLNASSRALVNFVEERRKGDSEEPGRDPI